MLDQGFGSNEEQDSRSSSSIGGTTSMAGLQRLRPVTMKDFETAVGKLKRSVSEKGSEENWQVYGNGTITSIDGYVVVYNYNFIKTCLTGSFKTNSISIMMERLQMRVCA
eukprot:scaffold366968_cov62-Attheya_sp.AAC.1